MLTITVPLSESFDEETSEFVVTTSFDLEFEHSLVTLSKWESVYEKPFLSKDEKSVEETFFYIHDCMLQTKNPPGEILQKLSQKHYDEIKAYMVAKRGAEWFRDEKRPGVHQTITSKVIYAWMVNLRIPFEAQHWHLNELLTLVRVCNEQKTPPRKMSRTDAMRQQASLNAQRRQQLGTRG